MSLGLKEVVPDNGLRFWIYITAKQFNAQDLFLVDKLTYERYSKPNRDTDIWFMKKEDANGSQG